MAGYLKSRFSENMQNAGKILGENGFEVRSYNAAIKDSECFRASAHANSSIKAFEQVLDLTRSLESIELEAGRVVGAYKDNECAEELLASMVRGGIEIEEPLTSLESSEKSQDNSDNLSSLAVPGFNIVIIYIPEARSGRWDVRATAVQEPFTQEDAKKKVDEISNLLEQNGMRVRDVSVN